MKTLLLSLLSLSTLALGAGKELDGERAAAPTTCPSPEEARAKMTVPEGYRVECFAHEPLIVNPVAMTWDTRGRLWVVEAFEYPEGTPLPVEKRPFGQEAKDDKYHPVPPQCLPTSSIQSRSAAETGEANRASSIPKDRVVILEDTDNDGVADKRTVFVEGLNLASAIICGDDGIYVGQQPHLLHFKDSDHDDKPDEWRVILTGFGREDTHELVNSFCWGPDGWLYMTHGVFTHSAVRRPGQPEKEGFKFDAGIGRCRPTQQGKEAPWEFEVFADGTSNPWGCDYDERGNFFVSACVIDHFFHMAPGGIYVRQGGAPENPYAYEQLPSIVTHKHFRAAYAGVQIYQGGVYPKDTWGHAFIGNIHDNAIHEEVLTPVGSTFKCEPRRDFLRANNGWFRPVSTRTGPDGNLWVMDWCDKYPCYQNAKANPEGVDRDRGRIWRIVATTSPSEGEKSRSDRLKSPSEGEKSRSDRPKGPSEGEKSRSDRLKGPSEGEKSRSDRPKGPSEGEKGRSDRPKGPSEGEKGASAGLLADHSRPEKDMDLAKLSTPELVKLLEHPNNWMRRWARRVLVERGLGSEKEEEDLFVQIMAKKDPRLMLELLWLFQSANRLDGAMLGGFASVGDPALDYWTSIAAGDVADSLGLFSAVTLASTANEGSPWVQVASAVGLRRKLFGLALTTDRLLGRGTGRDDAAIQPGSIYLSLITSAGKATGDALLPFSIWSAFEPWLVRQPQDATAVIAHDTAVALPISQTLTQRSMRRLCDTRDEKNLNLCLDLLTKIKAHDVLLAHALDGLVKGQEGGVIKPTKDFAALFAEFAKSSNADVRKHAKNLATLWGDPAAIRQLALSLLNAQVPEAERIAAIQTLRRVSNSDAVREALTKMLAKPESLSSALLVEAARAVGDAGGDAAVEPLIALAASKDQGVQIAAVTALINRVPWTHALLDAIDAKKVSASAFPATARRQLATSKHQEIRDHATKVLGVWKDSSDDIKALIAAKKKACLEGEPDLAAGKLLFTTTCAVCHTFYGGGQKVGPELIGSGRSNLDAILANVIDPNQIIGNGYENFIISTKDNRTLMGRITEDAPSHVKLLAIGGAEQTVPRDQIAKLENTHQSLMPMGFGGLPDDQFRNLIWYVLAPPDEGPLTADKKKLLSTSIDAPTKPKTAGASSRNIDWESISLWNPQWKVSAPDFQRTPMKLGEYYGRSNVLLMHPFEDKKTPASLEQKLVVDAARPMLKFSVAADDRGDWMVRVVVNGQVIKELPVDHEKPRWKDVVVDLSAQAGKETIVRLEGHATGWSWEFGYWNDVHWQAAAQ